MGSLHENATARHLAILRVWVFGMWLGDLLKDPATDLARIPFAYYKPVGILAWLPTSFWETALTEPMIRIWWGALAVLLVLTTAGTPFYRGVALLTCALLTVYQGVIFGFTSVTHAPLAALYVAWILALFPAADALSLRRAPGRSTSVRVYETAILTATVLFLVTYMLVGTRRLFDGGIDIFTDGSILRYIARNTITPDHLQGSAGVRVLESPGLSTMVEIGFAIVTIFEVLSPLCVASTWFRRAWLAVMIPFHVLSWPLLELLFLHNLLLLCVLVIDLDGIAQRIGLKRRLERRPLARGA
ncbi:MAG TPA: hypothetical protein VIE68_01910 [Gemmatimonadota bacterium]|jgi:hypothetical protein